MLVQESSPVDIYAGTRPSKDVYLFEAEEMVKVTKFQALAQPSPVQPVVPYPKCC